MRLGLCSFFLVVLLFPQTLCGKTVDTCFSPLGHCDQVLESWIKSAATSLDGAIYGLTDPDITRALIDAYRRGVAVRIIHDHSQSRSKNDVTTIIRKAGIPIHVQRGSRGGIQHNKFLIIDGKYVITGSFNWTRSAAHHNDENFVVLDDQAAKFQKEFDRLWNRH